MQGQETIGKKSRWAGRIIGWWAALFMLVNDVISLTKPAYVVEGTVAMGYPESTITVMALASLISTILYLIPRTSLFGAILMTAYYGGAVATHVRVGEYHLIWYAITFATMVWAGLWLRDARVRELTRGTVGV